MLLKNLINKRTVLLLLILLMFAGLNTYAGSQNEINVSNIAELESALQSAIETEGNTAIILEDGIYNLNQFIYITQDDMTIKSKSGDYSKVVINGDGMDGSMMHVFLIAADRFTVQGISFGNVKNHGIQVQGENGADYTSIKDCRIFDTREQMVKVSGGSEKDLASQFGLVENTLFEYTKGIGPQWYIGGVDAHHAENWTIRGNTFKYIRSPESRLAEHAIHFWSDSMNTVVENNTIIDCDRGIGFGLGDSKHFGGIIKNNFVYTTRDVGIGLENSAGTKVYNNTVYTEGYSNSIEYRFSGTRADIKNNLTNMSIQLRENGVATLRNNITDAEEDWFFDVKSGNLHLRLNADTVVDSGENLAIVNEDIDGDSRPNGLGYDIGADEVSAVQMEPSSWAKEAIYKLKSDSTIEQSFFGNYQNSISRKDFAYLAVKLYESLSNEQTPSVVSQDFTLFVDTNDTYVIKAFKLGIINGYGNGQFGPEDLVTREQINVMLIKTLAISDIELSKDQIQNIVFKDHNEISSWALESVRLAYKHKIMSGVAELTIAPKMNTTREQALFLVQKILDNKEEFVTEQKSVTEIETSQEIENPVAIIELDDGRNLEIELFPEIAPNTVNNFISLADSGFYDGLIFHRVIKDFMIQGGDPNGTGTGGPGYKIPGEFSENGFENNLSHVKGVISMARSSELNSAGSQFFIMHKESPHLDGKYAGFGKVIKGLEVIDEIANVATDNRDKPLENITMEKVSIELNGYESTLPVTID